jgi:hypothetical protein
MICPQFVQPRGRFARQRQALLGAAALFALFCSADANAHATLDVAEAASGAPYKATMKIGHGCEGTATTKVHIQIPTGVIAVKPMPKPGWLISIKKVDYGRTFNFYHGVKLSSGVSEITWEGGPLLDEHYDEFVFSAFVSDALAPGTTVHFPVVQTCEKGEHRWVEIAKAGQDPHALKSPAPVLKISSPSKTPDAKTFRLGASTIDSPWTRATPGGATTAGAYFTITNQGSTDDRILGGSLAMPGKVELHETTTANGVSRMRQLPDGATIKAGEKVVFQPGGKHVMFMGLTAGLAQGQSVKGTLVFEKAGTIEIEYAVAPLGAPQAAHSHH